MRPSDFYGTPPARRWAWRVFLPLLATLFNGIGARPAAAGTLLVANYTTSSNVLRYSAQTGASPSVAIAPGTGGLGNTVSHLLYGPDGNLYVSDYENSAILRFDAQSGTFVDVFVPHRSGGLSLPTDATFGPDRNLYVCSRDSNQVLEYNGVNGAFVGAFVSAGSGGLSEPDGLAFGPDGNLYVVGQGNNAVLRYNGTSGAFMGSFTPTSDPGTLSVPVDVRFGPGGALYVISNNAHQVMKYDGKTGALLGVFVPAGSGGMMDPLDMAFGPDGNLYVADHATNQILKYNGGTGAYLGVLVTAGSGGLNIPYALAFLPPRAPSQLAPAMVTGTQILLSWIDNSDDATGFAVWRRGGGHDWAQITTLPGGTTTYTDTGLLSGVPYTYQVTAVNAVGPSVPSNTLTVATGSPLPAPPASLSAWPLGPGQVFLQWLSPGSGVTGYSLWRQGGGSDWLPVALLSNPAVLGYTDTGLRPDTPYTYRVRAIGSLGTSDWSNPATILTPAVPPGAPTGLAAAVISTSQINLTWTLTSTDETAVTVWRKIGAGSFSRIAALPPHSTSYVDTSVAAATSYTYQVRVNNNYYASSWSNQVTASTPTPAS
jgi:Fibronectin type III domain